MTHDLFLGLLAFAFVSSITPGPNNLMLMSSGARFGLRRSVPHMLGIGLGFGIMIFAVGAGLMQILGRVPWFHDALRVVSVIYLLYLAWRVASAGALAPAANPSDTARPLNFWQAAAFQWVNPKAWTMALTALSIYAPSQTTAGAALVAFAFMLVNLPCISTWALMGQQIRRLLGTALRARLFNFAMAGLLLASMAPVLWP